MAHFSHGTTRSATRFPTERSENPTGRLDSFVGNAFGNLTVQKSHAFLWIIYNGSEAASLVISGGRLPHRSKA